MKSEFMPTRHLTETHFNSSLLKHVDTIEVPRSLIPVASGDICVSSSEQGRFSAPLSFVLLFFLLSVTMKIVLLSVTIKALCEMNRFMMIQLLNCHYNLIYICGFSILLPSS